MATSLQALREEVARRMRRFFTGTVEASPAPTPTDFTVLAIIDETPPTWDFENGVWVYVNGEARRADVIDRMGGRVIGLRPLPQAPSPGDIVGIYYEMSPQAWNDAVNDGLRRCWYVEEEDLTITAGARQYTPPAWVEFPNQVWQVFQVYRENADANREVLTPLVHSVWQDGATLRLDINPPMTQTGSNWALRVRGHRFYDPLAADSDTTTCPFELAVTAGILEARRRLYESAGRKNKMQYQAEYQQAMADWRAVARKQLPRVERPAFQLEEPFFDSVYEGF